MVDWACKTSSINQSTNHYHLRLQYEITFGLIAWQAIFFLVKTLCHLTIAENRLKLIIFAISFFLYFQKGGGHLVHCKYSLLYHAFQYFVFSCVEMFDYSTLFCRIRDQIDLPSKSNLI